MERAQQYVASLEQVVKRTHLDLRETLNQFQEYSRWFTVEREEDIPSAIVTDMRKTYRGIHDQLTKIRGIHQLLEGRYRQYYRRDSIRDRELSEFGTVSKNLYSKFEFMLQEMQAKARCKPGAAAPEPYSDPAFSDWFRSSENQLILLQNLRDLYGLDYTYKSVAGAGMDQKRRVSQNSPRSLSLFVLSGEGPLIDMLHFRMRLREHDIKERYAKNELRGALTHLREISALEVEAVIRRFMDSKEVPRVKCLLVSIQSEADLQKRALCSAGALLKEMASGEMRTLHV